MTIQNAARYDLIIEKENSNKFDELYIQNLGFDYRSEKPTISLGDDENPQ